MRWIFLSLLLLNGLVFFVQYRGWSAVPPKPQQAVVNEKAQPIILLKELSATDPYKTALVADSSQRTSRSAKEQRCLLFGPLYEEDVADELLSYLQQNRIEARKIVKERQIAPDYWVYIPPLPSRAQANKKLAELRVRKIDAYRISQGPLRNGISLGLFRNIDSARAMLEERRKQGLNAEMKEVRRTKIEYWIAPKEPLSIGLRARLDPLFLGNKVWSRVERREILCEGLASEKKVP